MTRRDTEARAAELAATPWPSPPGFLRHPEAAWDPGETCTCEECCDGREASTKARAALATAALARSASRSASLLSRRLDELAWALESNDDGVLGHLAEALDSDLDHTGSLLEALGVELECRRAR